MSHYPPALRLTPSHHSPFFKSTPPRSPNKAKQHEEPGLQLKKIIGTTTTSSVGFDSLPSARCFAYMAGAVAVVATVDDDLNVVQRFFRARPSPITSGRDLASAWPISPNEPRHRALNHARNNSFAGSPSGASGRDWSDSPTSKTITAKDRMRAVTSVALSPNGKWLAVGETGYKPRILIFSLAAGASEKPVCALSEHTFGVHALRFSPDSSCLASLGTINDGFLFIWTVDDRTGTASLHSSNKCTVLINSMAWLGNSVITAGLRLVKVWRPEEDSMTDERRLELGASVLTPMHRSENRSSEFANSILSPNHKVLGGKNCLLGDMLDCNFVAIVPSTATKALLCAEVGEICVLDDSEQAQTLTLVANAGFCITAACMERGDQLRVVAGFDQMKRFEMSELEQPANVPAKSSRRQTISPVKLGYRDNPGITAMATFGTLVVELDTKRGLSIYDSGAKPSATNTKRNVHIPAHPDAVLGVRFFTCEQLPTVAFLTFSGMGTVNLWSPDGDHVASVLAPIDASIDECLPTNGLKAVAPIENGSLLVAGDKYGTLSIIGIMYGKILSQVRAHAAEVLAIATIKQSGLDYIASSSRDRTVQVFVWKDGTLDLVQTLDEHAGAVTGLLFTADGSQLLSCSADRTVVVRERIMRGENEQDSATIAFVMLRAIALKSSPTTMCLGAGTDELYVASTDRCISKYSLRTGRASSSFKCSDSDGGEAVVMAQIIFVPSENGSTIAGVSGSDKSARLYTENGSLIARDWGHTEGITDVALLDGRGEGDSHRAEMQRLITVAADSTIFIWSIQSPIANQQSSGEVNGSADPNVATTKTLMGPPLRKVLSHTELSRFRRESSQGDSDPTSPTRVCAPTQPVSPQRLREKTSRISVAQTPRLEPAFRSTFADSSRRGSLRQRSPSPPSPRNAKKRDQMRRQSMANLRSKSTETVTEESLLSPPSSSSGFGSLTSSTESVSRALRSYRKKLASTSSETVTPNALRELEHELKLIARVLGERSQNKSFDETAMAKLLDQAGEKLVGLLDERIKERVVSEISKSNASSPTIASPTQVVAGGEEAKVHAVAGAFDEVPGE